MGWGGGPDQGRVCQQQGQYLVLACPLLRMPDLNLLTRTFHGLQRGRVARSTLPTFGRCGNNGACWLDHTLEGEGSFLACCNPQPSHPATGQGRGTVPGPLQTLLSVGDWWEELQRYNLKVQRPSSSTQGRQEKGKCRGGCVVQWL